MEICEGCGREKPQEWVLASLTSRYDACKQCKIPFPRKRCHHCNTEFFYNPKHFPNPTNCPDCQAQRHPIFFPVVICHHCGNKFWYDPSKFSRPPTNCPECQAQRHPR